MYLWCPSLVSVGQRVVQDTWCSSLSGKALRPKRLAKQRKVYFRDQTQRQSRPARPCCEAVNITHLPVTGKTNDVTTPGGVKMVCFRRNHRIPRTAMLKQPQIVRVWYISLWKAVCLCKAFRYTATLTRQQARSQLYSKSVEHREGESCSTTPSKLWGTRYSN